MKSCTHFEGFVDYLVLICGAMCALVTPVVRRHLVSAFVDNLNSSVLEPFSGLVFLPHIVCLYSVQLKFVKQAPKQNVRFYMNAQ
jgi:hypothetical protein